MNKKKTKLTKRTIKPKTETPVAPPPAEPVANEPVVNESADQVPEGTEFVETPRGRHRKNELPIDFLELKCSTVGCRTVGRIHSEAIEETRSRENELWKQRGWRVKPPTCPWCIIRERRKA